MENQVTVITPADAKARALTVLEANKECISFVRREDLDTAALYVPVVSVIKPAVGDFHDNIPGIGILPKVPLMNLMREKAGVNIHRTETAKRDRYVWVAHAYGDKRQPDGTMLSDDASYEFDAEVRAELDFINDKQAKYTSEILKRKHLLELAKFGEQKAVTGAQLALIHKLAKVPASYKSPEELMRGLVVLRVDRNVDGLLNDPAMRGAVIANALGARDSVFGPAGERDVTPQAAQIAAPADDPEPDFGDAPAEPPAGMEITPPTEPTPEQKAIAEARAALESWLATDAVKAHRGRNGRKSAGAAIREAIDAKDTPIKRLRDLLELCPQVQANYEKAQAQKGGAV